MCATVPPTPKEGNDSCITDAQLWKNINQTQYHHNTINGLYYICNCEHKCPYWQRKPWQINILSKIPSDSNAHNCVLYCEFSNALPFQCFLAWTSKRSPAFYVRSWKFACSASYADQHGNWCVVFLLLRTSVTLNHCIQSFARSFEWGIYSPLTLIQGSNSMLDIFFYSLSLVLKRFRLLNDMYERDKDSLSKVLMFVQSHAQNFLLPSTILYNTTWF